jgi:hypothetical protein
VSFPADIDENFTIIVAKETVTKEELPRLLGAIAGVVAAAGRMATHALTRNWEGIAAEAVTIVRHILEIKKILET